MIAIPSDIDFSNRGALSSLSLFLHFVRMCYFRFSYKSLLITVVLLYGELFLWKYWNQITNLLSKNFKFSTKCGAAFAPFTDSVEAKNTHDSDLDSDDEVKEVTDRLRPRTLESPKCQMKDLRELKSEVKVNTPSAVIDLTGDNDSSGDDKDKEL